MLSKNYEGVWKAIKKGYVDYFYRDFFWPLLYCVAKIECSFLHRVNLIEVTYALG